MLKPWQFKQQMTVRLTTSGAKTTIRLPKQFIDVEEIRLAEQHFVGYNGGVSAACYLEFVSKDFTSPVINNENNVGCLINVNVLTSHMIYHIPRTVVTSSLGTLNQFDISLHFANGTAPLFTEASLVFDVVMHRPALEAKELRNKMAMWVGQQPQIKGVDPRSQYGADKF